MTTVSDLPTTINNNWSLDAVKAYIDQQIKGTERTLNTNIEQFQEQTLKTIEAGKTETINYIDKQLDSLKLDTTRQLQQHKSEVEQKIDETISNNKDIQDIKQLLLDIKTDSTKRQTTTITTTDIGTIPIDEMTQGTPAKQLPRTQPSPQTPTVTNLPLPPNRPNTRDSTHLTPANRYGKMKKLVNKSPSDTHNDEGMLIYHTPKTLFPSERAATPSEQYENRQEINELAVSQQ
jgi:vacuolar-type H+-ATPase subunit H